MASKSPAADPPSPGTFYLEAGAHELFGRFHPAAAGVPAARAVLVCPPWGPDEVASYRSRRAWALRLAAAGHPTLRFDLPGTGNSSGWPTEDGFGAAWREAVRSAAAWLATTTGQPRVAALGLGLGGLLAQEAIASGAAIDELVLWSAPSDGRAFLREMRRFARLQAMGGGGSGSDQLADGWLEVDGFVLGPVTIAELETMGQAPGPLPGLRRVLAISRRADQDQAELAGQLERTGAAVEVDASGRWSAFVSHPEDARLPAEVADLVERWLERGEGDDEGAAPQALPAAPAATAELTLQAVPTAVVERPLSVSMPFGEVYGLLAQPATGASSGCCVVFLNAGALRNIGPNRMWVERARAWAARGISSLRVDLEEIGEGGGDPDGIPPGDEHFSPKYESQIEAVLDALEREGLGPRFYFVGLCSGAFHAYRTALADERVRGAALINPSVLIWRPGIFAERELRMNVGFLGEGRRLRRLLRGEIGPKRVAAYLGSLARGGRDFAAQAVHRRGHRPPSWEAQLQEEFELLDRRGQSLVIAFSGGEEMEQEMEEVAFGSRVAKLSRIEFAELPGADHTLRPIAAQRKLAALLEEQLSKLTAGSALAVPR